MSTGRRLVRRKPFLERVKAALDVGDFLIWVSEELETRDWDSKSLGTKIGLISNVAFLVARANVGKSSSRGDGVFTDDDGGPGYMQWLVQFLVWSLMAASVLNAFFALTRSRQYRLFEANIEQQPKSESAQRVRVQSAPVSSSPMRFLNKIIAQETADSRTHPDKSRDVWEMSVWDPLPLCLRIFCLFSPGHILVYRMFLPVQPMEERPSVVVFNCIFLQVILSCQLLILQSRFTQQVKDTTLIHKEVMHEYDEKYVRPRLHPVVRDVATQMSDDTWSAEVGTPTTLIRRSFQTHPNPNYIQHIDPHAVTSPLEARSVARDTGLSFFRKETTPVHQHRPAGGRQSLPSSSPQYPFPLKHAPAQATGNINFGGNMGVYTHSNSPLKKATSMGDMNASGMFSPRNSREMAAREQQQAENRRQSSPAKSVDPRRVTPGYGDAAGNARATGNAFNRARVDRLTAERYPSRW